MIINTKTSIFDSQADYLVNPVNCEGVMGAGLAKQFRLRYPHNYNVYREVCARGELKPGELMICASKGSDGRLRHIINLATKDTWREGSRPEWIEQGLHALVSLAKHHEAVAVALPRLGCGLGGLDWETLVELLYDEILAPVVGINFIVCEP